MLWSFWKEMKIRIFEDRFGFWGVLNGFLMMLNGCLMSGNVREGMEL